MSDESVPSPASLPPPTPRPKRRQERRKTEYRNSEVEAINRRPSIHKANCRICRSPTEAARVKAEFEQWISPVQILNKLARMKGTGRFYHEVTPALMIAHCALLRKGRRTKTEPIYEAIVEQGMRNPAGLDVRASDMQRAAEWLDKLTGKFKEEKGGPPPVIIMQAVPRAGGVVDTGKETLQLPPGAIQVGPPTLEAAAGSAEVSKPETEGPQP